ncbi:hypothetical protein ACFYY8_31245 [Streptosporangium sp. NPDC001559]|uniref:hypothetical protein n=1 Tax=Streptosporangium sp. NPDC001559 TaxID=3366187 RepID=UPI0036EDCA84
MMADKTVYCSNPDHARRVPAIARLSWPTGRFSPTAICITDLPGQIRQSLDLGHPVLVEPITSEEVADRG